MKLKNDHRSKFSNLSNNDFKNGDKKYSRNKSKNVDLHALKHHDLKRK